MFDLAHVVTSARTQAMPASVAARLSVESGSFFDAVPPGQVDPDRPDDRCVQILRSCERSLAPGGVVLVVDTVLGRRGHEVDAAFSDLTMLVLPGGRERTEQQYAAFFDDAGLRLSRTLDTTSRYSIVEARSARSQGA